MDTHPPWLRFHLGITRRELYDRRDPNLDQLTHYMATQRILGAGQRALTLPPPPLPPPLPWCFTPRVVRASSRSTTDETARPPGGRVLWITAPGLVFAQVRSCRSDSAPMPSLAAFKQTGPSEREPEAALTPLCRGSYLELRKRIFRSAQPTAVSWRVWGVDNQQQNAAALTIFSRKDGSRASKLYNTLLSARLRCLRHLGSVSSVLLDE